MQISRKSFTSCTQFLYVRGGPNDAIASQIWREETGSKPSHSQLKSAARGGLLKSPFSSMNPRICMKCLLHGTTQSHCSQDCPMKICPCSKCQIVDSRRTIANKLFKLARQQRFGMGVNGMSIRYTCARCRNHGLLTMKKYHTPCPFSLCQCEACSLIAEKNRIDSELKSISHHDDQRDDRSPSQSDSEHESTPETTPFCLDAGTTDLNPDAKVIRDLISALASDSFDPETFDYRALADFFSQPSILIPQEWAPMMGEIIEMVHIALRMFPRFEGIDFRAGPFPMA